MSIASRSKQLVYLTHRWTGIAGCLLMLLWFVSGIVMLYVGYPKLTPWERLGALPELDARHCCAALDEPAFTDTATSGAWVLTSIGGAPAYTFRNADDLTVYDGTTATPLPAPVTADQAVRAARLFASAPATHRGLIDEDRWTHSRGLDVHRPLHKVDVDAPTPATLFVSSRTGQVVLDAPLSQQRWNYVGAWLHWLYAFRSTSVDPAWSWIVIVLSFVGTVSALSGLCVGLWRWRFGGRYKTGSHSPYREPWMKWHHVAGLLFGAFVCTWIFSGLMSMNPEGVLSPRHRPDANAYAGDPRAAPAALGDPREVITALNAAGFHPIELAWHRLGGQNYVLAHNRLAQTRIVRMQEDELAVAKAWTAREVAPAARRLFAAAVIEERLVFEHEPYYYQRHPEAMNGALVRGLPALRVDFADPDRTRVYIDLNTGQIGASLSRQERAGRWLFYFLHSWDTPGLLGTQALRDAVLIFLSLGGIVVSAAGTVIAWRRLRRRGRAGRV